MRHQFLVTVNVNEAGLLEAARYMPIPMPDPIPSLIRSALGTLGDTVSDIEIERVAAQKGILND